MTSSRTLHHLSMKKLYTLTTRSLPSLHAICFVLLMVMSSTATLQSQELMLRVPTTDRASADTLTYNTKWLALQSNTAKRTILDTIIVSVSIVDFRKVPVGSIKDSVVSAMIVNTSNSVARVDSMVLIGNDSPNFAILGETFPFTINPRSSHACTLRFAPLSVGLKDVALRVYSQRNIFWGALAGEGISPIVSLVTDLIDFGSVTLGQWKDTLSVITLQNISKSPIVITKLRQGGPDSLPFSIMQAVVPYTLKPGEVMRTSIRFQPLSMDSAFGSVLMYVSGMSSPAVLLLKGNGVGNHIAIADDSCAVGERRSIAISLLDSLPSMPTSYGFKAHITSPIANYFPSKVQNLQLNGESIAFDVQGKWDGTSHLLGTFDVEGVIASVQKTPLVLDSFEWLDSVGTALPYQTTRQDGSFSLTNLCTAGGTRLVNATGAISLSMISPHPLTSDQAQLNFQTSEDSPTTIDLVDCNGMVARNFVNATLSPGTHSLSLDFQSVPNGMYILRMRTATELRTESLLLVR